MAKSLKKGDFTFLSDCEGALARERSGLANTILFLVVAFTVAFVAWAANSEVDEATKAQGKIVPSSATQIVQSLEGGILSELYVKEGEMVEKGGKLLLIDDTQYAANLRQTEVQIATLEARMARLMAEATGVDEIEFPESILNGKPERMERERELFAKRRKELEKQTETTRFSLSLAEKEMKMTKPLADEGIVAEVDILRLEREINELSGRLSALTGDFQTRALEEHSGVKAQLNELNEMISAYQDRVTRSLVKSPMEGVVQKVHTSTIGGVIRSGDPIIEIVPLDDERFVEAFIMPQDIAFVEAGQEAIVRVSAYDYSIYGSLHGEVERVSADAFQLPDGSAVFKIKIRLNTKAIEYKGKDLELQPGMTADVSVVTGRKTILQYLMKPFLKFTDGALKEA